MGRAIKLDSNLVIASLLNLAVYGMATVKRAIFFGLHAGGMLPFVLGGGVVLVLALGALELNDFAGHKKTSP
jgi:hypothetical protein